ncbi:hypothetical protein [Variovorax sp.]|jgi:hypothetical protein|uniref:hypothetical protein n=1 Tax=Variovorax sp. TaxID=1871043 RepID=UPI0037DA0A0C
MALFLKLFSTVLTGLFGVLALLVDYRDRQTNKIGKWGKVALAGVLVSSTVSLVTQGIDERQNQLEGARRAAEAEELKSKLARLADPLAPPDVYVNWALPKKIVGGDVFLASMKDLASSLGKSNSSASTKDYFISHKDVNGAPMDIDLTADSKYHPNKDAEPNLFALLNYPGVEVAIVRNPDDLKKMSEKFRQSGGRASIQGDYVFSVGYGNPNVNTGVSFNVGEQRIYSNVSGPVDARFIAKTGAVISMYDLAASSLVVKVSHTMVVNLDGNHATLQANRNAAAPAYFQLTANGRKYAIRQWDVTESANGFRMFSAGPLSDFTQEKDAERKREWNVSGQFPVPQTKE